MDIMYRYKKIYINDKDNLFDHQKKAIEFIITREIYSESERNDINNAKTLDEIDQKKYVF